MSMTRGDDESVSPYGVYCKGEITNGLVYCISIIYMNVIMIMILGTLISVYFII